MPGNNIGIMGKKKKNKQPKAKPASKKAPKIMLNPEERARIRLEIVDILQAAKKESKAKIEAAKSRVTESFSFEQVNTFISDLKFKKADDNKKVASHKNIIKEAPGAGKTDENADTTKRLDSMSYYNRWFKLVEMRTPPEEESSIRIEVPKTEKKTLPKGVSTTIKTTYTLYKENLTVDEIAKMRKLTAATIYQHLSQLVEIGVINVSDLLNNKKIKDISAAIKKAGMERLSQIKSLCPPTITYNDIKLMLSDFKKKKK